MASFAYFYNPLLIVCTGLLSNIHALNSSANTNSNQKVSLAAELAGKDNPGYLNDDSFPRVSAALEPGNESNENALTTAERQGRAEQTARAEHDYEEVDLERDGNNLGEDTDTQNTTRGEDEAWFGGPAPKSVDAESRTGDEDEQNQQIGNIFVIRQIPQDNVNANSAIPRRRGAITRRNQAKKAYAEDLLLNTTPIITLKKSGVFKMTLLNFALYSQPTEVAEQKTTATTFKMSERPPGADSADAFYKKGDLDIFTTKPARSEAAYTILKPWLVEGSTFTFNTSMILSQLMIPYEQDETADSLDSNSSSSSEESGSNGVRLKPFQSTSVQPAIPRA